MFDVYNLPVHDDNYFILISFY